MSIWRVYARVSLAGLGLLAVADVVFLLGHDAVGTYGFFVLTFYWAALCAFGGLILAALIAIRRLVDQRASTSE